MSSSVRFIAYLSAFYLIFANFLRVLAVAFFDTKFTQDMCNKFYLFEPVTTMVLVSLCSAVHVIRVHAIYDKSRAILGGLGAVLLLQVSPFSLCCPPTERLLCPPPQSPTAAIHADPNLCLSSSLPASQSHTPFDFPSPISLSLSFFALLASRIPDDSLPCR